MKQSGSEKNDARHNCTSNAGTGIGMGSAVLLAFVKTAIAEQISPSGGLLPLPSGLTAAILIAILWGVVGGIIGLIVGAFGLRTYQGDVVGILFIVLRWRPPH